MTQVVEHLPRKCKVLSSNSSTTKKKRRKERRKEGREGFGSHEWTRFLFPYIITNFLVGDLGRIYLKVALLTYCKAM
jgi:hypothetical protein